MSTNEEEVVAVAFQEEITGAKKRWVARVCVIGMNHKLQPQKLV